MAGKRKWFVAVIASMLLAGAGAAAWWVTAPVSTEYITVQKEDAIETLLAAGKVVGEATIPLSFAQAGVVGEVLVEEGELVEEAKVLLSLESSRFANLVSQRQNALARGKVSLERLQNEELAGAREQLNLAISQQQHAETVYLRNLELFREGVISTAELEAAEQSLEQATSNLELSKITLQGLEDTSLRLARLEVEQAEVLLEEAKMQLADTYLHAPLTGTVISLDVNSGEYVQPGQPLLKLIPKTDFTYVEVEVDEDLSGRIMVGQEGIVSASASPGKHYQATVSRVAPAIDAARGTFTVRLTLEEEVPSLLPEQAVFAEIITGKRDDALILEQRLILREAGRMFVYTVEDDQARRRELVTEDLGNGRMAVLEGLEAGERVLTSLELRDGQRVQLRQERE